MISASSALLLALLACVVLLAVFLLYRRGEAAVHAANSASGSAPTTTGNAADRTSSSTAIAASADKALSSSARMPTLHASGRGAGAGILGTSQALVAGIATEVAALDAECTHDWRLVFSTDADGRSFPRLSSVLAAVHGPTLIVVEEELSSAAAAQRARDAAAGLRRGAGQRERG